MHNSHSIYLDNNTTTRPSEQAVAKMLPFLTERWGVASAPHQVGQQLFPAIDEALRGIYALLGAKEQDTVLFTSSAAEGVNHVILSTYFDVTVHTGKNQYITSAIDEAPAIMAMGRLEQLSCLGKMVPADKYGRITAQAIADMLTPRTALVSLSWANGLTGVVNPIIEIAELCQERGVRLHLDVSHALGKLFTDWEEVPAQFMTFNGDSFHAPSGTGGLYIRSDVRCSPFILGGSEQAGQRAGSFSVAGLVALGQAAREALDARDLICTEVARLRSKFENDLIALLPDVVVFFRDQERLPNCTAMAFPGVANEALLYLLNRKGVYASIGGGTFQQIGLVLAACGVEEVLAHSAISFSLSRETTEDDIDRAVGIIVECVKRLRKVSNKWLATDEVSK
ncbi:cysteine desulfurase family protein [Candidatus Magnetobacterium casense]|uniref:Cysteine desulfurase n=1 Tax=Candidatus Magnetobacterium casense TaxID=1455061 RepID=A0ABS6S2S1_9BACT|nr:cysteine desulfurase family protein [Candidatus Magnetobacterium casensis]MBV6343131.1 cysteine desulfurase [Candidatus Magnetobacterium casensis]